MGTLSLRPPMEVVIAKKKKNRETKKHLERNTNNESTSGLKHLVLLSNSATNIILTQNSPHIEIKHKFGFSCSFEFEICKS